MPGRRRARERGAETLEFLGVLPFVLLLAVMFWQVMVLIGEHAEAQDDARAIARIQVACPAQPAPALISLDPQAAGGTVTRGAGSGDSNLISVTVQLPPHWIIKDPPAIPLPSAVATVTMRREPC